MNMYGQIPPQPAAPVSFGPAQGQATTSGAPSPQELQQAALILQHASIDELHIAFSQGPPELKDLVTQELQRRAATGDAPPTDPGAAVPGAATPGAAVPADAMAGLAGLSMPSKSLSPFSNAGTGGNAPALALSPLAHAMTGHPQPRSARSLPFRGPLLSLRPPLTRSAISPMAEVPTRLGAPEASPLQIMGRGQ